MQSSQHFDVGLLHAKSQRTVSMYSVQAPDILWQSLYGTPAHLAKADLLTVP